MTAVIGTAGHIDHGKTTLLRALTGTDPDRLPEEQRRGMTIDVGYAHLALPDGRDLDFVDVPGHDRLVGNMLVGAGEIDAVLLVVAADDGPRAQTLEHLALVDALGLADGLAVVTKADLVDPDRLEAVREQLRALLLPTGLAGVPILSVSAATGLGLDALQDQLVGLADRVGATGSRDSGPRLAVDRAFGIRGRGAVVTGSLRGGSVAPGTQLRLLPDGRSVRVREVQVHGQQRDVAGPGRAALNLAAIDVDGLGRGMVLTSDPAVVASDRLLVALSRPRVTEIGRRMPTWPPRDGARARLHLGTADVESVVGRAGRDALELPDGRAVAVLRLTRPVAAAPGDRFVLRRPSPGSVLAGGVVLDPGPSRGVSRRRQTAERVAAMAAAVASADASSIADARLALHGATAGPGGAATIRVAPDVLDAAVADVRAAVAAWHAAHPSDPGMPLPALRTVLERTLRRWVTLGQTTAAAVVDGALAAALEDGALVREGDSLRGVEHRPGGPDPALLAAMDRLEAALTGDAPPPLAATAAAQGCPEAGIRALSKAGRIVILEPDLAWAAGSYRVLAARALVMAQRAPLTPAAYRDATGTSRRYCLAILEDLDRRGILRRTDAGHVPGPKAPPRPAATSGGAPPSTG